MVGESTATATTKINAHTVLFEWYRECCAIDMDHLRLCAALDGMDPTATCSYMYIIDTRIMYYAMDGMAWARAFARSASSYRYW